MTAKRLSPTANLLRKSRLFSLPSPLPQPSHDLTSTSKYTSETATLPYPTHAAIETPQSSLSRGDWGLKRPLPLRATTETSTPTIRVDAVDTLEHITNFDSASDHVLTLRKWQEFQLPMSTAEEPKKKLLGSSSRRERHRSVFERYLDNTASDEQNVSQQGQRWKFKGPWLAGKSEGEFCDYLGKEIRRRKPEFRDYLRERFLAAQTAERRRVARERGEDQDNITAASEMSEDDLRTYVRHLRHNHSALNTLIHQFLDLPVASAPTDGESHLFGSPRKASKASGTSLYSETGPPKTHPSAGLSYLRASSYLNNHPKLGPQLSRPPVEGRILRPMRSTTARPTQPLIGIGGIVAEDRELRGSFKDNLPGMSYYDGTIAGGAKAWYHPNRASIDAQGRIKLQIDMAEEDTIAIHKEKVDRKPVDDVMEVTDRTWPIHSPSSGSASGYGLENRSSKTGNRAEPLEVPPDRRDTREDLIEIIEKGATKAGYIA
ncbi:MAG: hypothetical protein M1830_002266 [Pleopsidium flavum]|nr:MAG: hypothetical protein M1830_002266 [Pleopsidium flavum]